MYSIGDISRLTGITIYTLRYYEKIGVLPESRRHNGKQGGIRQYDEADLRFIRFIHSLKQTGMKLEDIIDFMDDGCLLALQEEGKADIADMLHRRIGILSGHIDQLDRRLEQLEAVKEAAHEKRAYYLSLLEEQF